MANILQIIDYAAPYKGNFIASLLYLKRYILPVRTFFLLTENARNLDWVNAYNSKEKDAFFIDKSFFSNRISIRHVMLLRRLCKKHKISIIHTHFMHHNLNLLVLTGISRIRVICHLHNHYTVSGFKGKIKSWVLKHTASLFIGVSNSVAESARQVLRTNRVVPVVNAIDFSRLDSAGEIPHEPVNNTRILMFGWPYHRKGVDIVIKALDTLIRKGQIIELDIVLAGGIEIVTGEIEKDFSTFPGFVKFLPPVEDIGLYFNSHDIMVSASREEGFNYTLVEGAYCNCMLVSSNISGVPVEIPHLELFESENPASLVFSLEKIMEADPARRKVIREQQRDFCTSTYSLDKWANEVQACYTTIL